MAQNTVCRAGCLQELIGPLQQQILNCGMSCELVDSYGDRFGEVTVWVMIYEKYFMRSSNRASLTLTLIETGGVVTANVMASGGGQGAWHRFSWGTEESFAQSAWGALASMGFA